MKMIILIDTSSQGHAVLRSRVGHGRQEPSRRRRWHQDEVSQRQQPYHQVKAGMLLIQ